MSHVSTRLTAAFAAIMVTVVSFNAFIITPANAESVIAFTPVLA